MGFSPLVGHVLHDFYFQLTNLTKLTKATFYLHDFVNLNFGRVPGSHTKGDFFPTKKACMAANHFSMKDYAFLLYKCYKLREDENVDAITWKNEIFAYFDVNESFLKSAKEAYESNRESSRKYENLRHLSTALDVINVKLDLELERYAKILFLYKGNAIEGFKVFLHHNQSFLISMDDRVEPDMKSKIESLQNALNEWNNEVGAAKEFLCEKDGEFQLKAHIEEALDKKLTTLDVLIEEIVEIACKSNCEECSFAKSFRKLYFNGKGRKWSGKSWKLKLSYYPPLPFFFATGELNDKIQLWKSIASSWTEGLIPSFDKVEPELEALFVIVKSFREVYAEIRTQKETFHTLHMNSEVCKNFKSNSFDDCFRFFRENSLKQYVDALYSCVKHPEFAKYTAEGVILSVIWNKFINNANDLEHYFAIVKNFIPDFSIDSLSTTDPFELSVMSKLSFIPIPYGRANYKGFSFANCAEAAVRNFIRLLAETRTLGISLSDDLKWWTDAFSDQQNILYAKVSKYNILGYKGFVKSSEWRKFEDDSFVYYESSADTFGYEMKSNIFNVLVSVDRILQLQFFDDWNILDREDGIERGMKMMAHLGLEMNISDDRSKVRITFLELGVVASFDFGKGFHTSFDFSTMEKEQLSQKANIFTKSDPDLHSFEFLQYVLQSPVGGNIDAIADGPFNNALTFVLMEHRDDSSMYSFLLSILDQPDRKNLFPFILGSIHDSQYTLYIIERILMALSGDSDSHLILIKFLNARIMDKPHLSFEFYKDLAYHHSVHGDLFIKQCFDGVNVKSVSWEIEVKPHQKSSSLFVDPSNYFHPSRKILLAEFDDLDRYFVAFKNLFYGKELLFPGEQLLNWDDAFPLFTPDMEALCNLYGVKVWLQLRRTFIQSLYEHAKQYPSSTRSLILSNSAISFSDFYTSKLILYLMPLEDFKSILNFEAQSADSFEPLFKRFELLHQKRVDEIGEYLVQRYSVKCLNCQSHFLRLYYAFDLCKKGLWSQLLHPNLDFLFTAPFSPDLSPFVRNYRNRLFILISNGITAITDDSFAILIKLIDACYGAVFDIFHRLCPVELHGKIDLLKILMDESCSNATPLDRNEKKVTQILKDLRSCHSS